MKIGIVGLGLIGGSLGLSLKNEKLISCVSGMDLNKEHEKQAMQLGLVHEILPDALRHGFDYFLLGATKINDGRVFADAFKFFDDFDDDFDGDG